MFVLFGTATTTHLWLSVAWPNSLRFAVNLLRQEYAIAEVSWPLLLFFVAVGALILGHATTNSRECALYVPLDQWY